MYWRSIDTFFFGRSAGVEGVLYRDIKESQSVSRPMCVCVCVCVLYFASRPRSVSFHSYTIPLRKKGSILPLKDRIRMAVPKDIIVFLEMIRGG